MGFTPTQQQKSLLTQRDWTHMLLIFSSVPALPHYSWGEMLTLSFIDQVNPNLWHSSFSAKTTGVPSWDR